MLHIILVDDEVVSVNALKRRVDWKLYGVDEVFTANSMYQAQEIFKKETIDFMICDIEMPQGSGLDLFEWVKMYYPEVECIYVSCHPEFEYIRRALQLGSADYILKPIDYEELNQILTQVVERRNKKPELEQIPEQIIHDLVKKEAQEKQIYEVTLIYQDKTFNVKALYDSGNTLMTRKSEPVHVLAPSIWKELIGEDPWKEDGFAVPYQTVSETSVMPGIYLDEIHLKEKAITEKKQQLVKENSKEKVLVLRHVPIGLGSMEFDKAGECQMLLHRDTFD